MPVQADKPTGRFSATLATKFDSVPTAPLLALVLVGIITVAALFAPVLAPHDTLNPAVIDLNDSELPPAWLDRGDGRFVLGTDNQGRDVLSAILFGLRTSLVVGFGSVLLALAFGLTVGVASGFAGGLFDSFAMRMADFVSSFPAILVALLIAGLTRAVVPLGLRAELMVLTLIAAIAITTWPQYARIARGLTLVQRSREYILAARLCGLHSIAIMVRHLLPNVLAPVLVIGALNVGMAVLAESTLSFLGVGMPPTHPSLGTLIRVGNQYLFSGTWWVVVFPSLTLALLVFAMNAIADWLRDVLDPKFESP